MNERSGIPEFMREEGVTSIEGHNWLPLNGASLPKSGDMYLRTQVSPVMALITVIHEYIHFKHPDWPESKVMEDERRLLFLLGIKE